MTKLIDTHAHIYHKQFEADRGEMLKRAFEIAEFIFMPNVDMDSIPGMAGLAEAYPGACRQMMGLHPCHVDEQYEHVLDKMSALFDAAPEAYVGVGETGLDLYWDKTTLKIQQESLAWHIEEAKKRQLPLVLHCRDSFPETVEMIEAAQDGSLKGVFHCFTGNEADARRVADAGFLMGIGGVVTFKKSEELRDAVKKLPLEHFVLETDCPYLAPAPRRGKRNEPAYLEYIAQTIAETRGERMEAVAEATSANAKRLFLLN